MPRTARRTKADASQAATLRVIGGLMRGRTFVYNGDPNLRPMKDRVREATFNLVGPAVRGKHVVDLFAGTGAMTFEAISRGATSAVLFERRFPNVRAIEQNLDTLGVGDRADVLAGDAFLLSEELEAGETPWLTFCCPPYDFYQSRTEEMLRLIERIYQLSPPSSLLVVEADTRFDPTQLAHADEWDVRTYAPAVIAIREKLDSP